MNGVAPLGQQTTLLGRINGISDIGILPMDNRDKLPQVALGLSTYLKESQQELF